MKLYINKKVLWGLITSIIIILGLGILSYQYFLSLTAATQWTNHARRVVQNVEEVRSMLVSVENEQRGYSLTGDERFIRLANVSISNLRNLLNDLETTTSDNQTQQDNIRGLRALVSIQIESIRGIIEARKTSFEKAMEEAKAVANKETLEKIQQSLDHIKQVEQSLILTRTLQVQTGFYRFVLAFLGLILVTLTVLLGLVWLINSNTKSRTIAEENLREAQLETSKVNADLESFSYSVSHDLRAPLRSINGYSQILIEDYAAKLDDEGNRILNIIISNAKKMGQLIDDLLEFSRLGRQEINRTIVDVEEQVKTICEELIEREPDRKIDLKIQTLGTAKMDSNMMRQVWINLIGNAIKYSRNKEVATIEIGRTEQDGKMIFYVKDNGAGFDMAYVNKLFGVFQRLHKNNEFEGTGVGLALVKRIVNRHNGEIWAEAQLEKGATFYFSLLVD
jgi:signal transduction histidine kinase